MIQGDLLSACPHRQFHTLPGLLDSWAALPNSNPNACVPMQGGSLYHFYDGLWYDPAERQTHDLACERRTHYRLSQPDTVTNKLNRSTGADEPWFLQQMPRTVGPQPANQTQRDNVPPHDLVSTSERKVGSDSLLAIQLP